MTTRPRAAVRFPTFTMVGGQPASLYGNDPRTLTWTDGTPTASGSNAQGLYAGGTGRWLPDHARRPT
jgi:hypothetical protein